MLRWRLAIFAAVTLVAPPAQAAESVAAPPVESCPDDATGSRVYSMFLAGNRAGYHLECRIPDGSRLFLFEYNDRGRGPSVRSRIAQDAAGIPTSITVDGNDYLKSEIAERFSIAKGMAAWKNKVEQGERRIDAPAFYLSQSGTPAELPMLAKAAAAAPGHSLPLLPSGEARVEALDARTVKNGDASVAVRLHAVHGLGFQPVTVWLDEQGGFFASLDSWVTLAPEGWEHVAPELLAVQEARAMKPGTSVLVEGNAIRAVGPDGSLAVPEGATRIDATGRALVPGLWDMHSHPEPADGLLLLAAGVTGVRDMAAEPSKRERMRSWETGETLGPRVAYAGIVDGPGPFQGPTQVLVGTEAAARAAVDAMADAGFVQSRSTAR
jgi:hypothetical protein